MASGSVFSALSVPFTDVDAFPLPGTLANRPVCTSFPFLGWCAAHVKYRIDEVGPARTTNVYFAQAGNDTTGDGTAGNPYKTLLKAQQVIDASSGDLGLWFAEGDVWLEWPYNKTISSASGTSITLSAGTPTVLPRVGMKVVLWNASNAYQMMTVTNYNSGTRVITTQETVTLATPTSCYLGQVLYPDKPNMTVGYYRPSGSTKNPKAKPEFTAFKTGYSNGSWTLDTGTTYVLTEAANTNLGWIRYTGDDTSLPLRKMASQAACEAQYGSWFQSGTSVYVNPYVSGATPNAGDRTLQGVIKNPFFGIACADVDDIVIQDLTVSGYGAVASGTTTDQGNGVTTAVTGTNRFLMRNCTVVYNGRHAFTQLGATAGGIVTLVGNKMGWMVCDTLIAVAYNSAGGQNAVFAYNTWLGGKLPTGATPYTYADSGPGSHVHTAGGAAYVGFALNYRNKFETGPWMAWGESFANLATWSDLADCVAYVVRETWPDRVISQNDASNPWANDGNLGTGLPQSEVALINCTLKSAYVKTYDGEVPIWTSFVGFGINSKLIWNFQGCPGRKFTAFRAGSPNGTAGTAWDTFEWYYGLVEWRTYNGNNYTGFIGKLINTAGAGNVTATGKLVACVLNNPSKAEKNQGLVAFANNTANLKGNAYVGMDYTKKSNSSQGYDQDADIVELPSYDDARPLDTSLDLAAAQLVKGYVLEYDFDGNRRRGTTARGPYEKLP